MNQLNHSPKTAKMLKKDTGENRISKNKINKKYSKIEYIYVTKNSVSIDFYEKGGGGGQIMCRYPLCMALMTILEIPYLVDNNETHDLMR